MSDEQIVHRLQRAQQVYELTAQQERYLKDRGLSEHVLSQMRAMNRDASEEPQQAAADVPVDNRESGNDGR